MKQLFEYSIGTIETNSRIWQVCWNPKGTLVAACGEDRTIRLLKYDPSSTEILTPVSNLNGTHSRAIRSVSFSHSGRFLVSSSFDASVGVYERNENGEWEEANKLEGHENEVKAASFSPSDQFLATCSRDKSVWFWQMDEDNDFSVTSVLQPHTGDVKSVIWHPNEELAVSLSYDASIRFYKFDGEDFITQQKIDQAHEGTVWAGAFDANGDYLITIGDDQIIQLWAREPKTESALNSQWKSVLKYRVTDCRWPLYSISWNHKSGLIAVGAGDKAIRIFNLEKAEGNEVLVLKEAFDAHGSDVNCVAWHPSEPSLLASCSDEGNIKLFHVDL